MLVLPLNTPTLKIIHYCTNLPVKVTRSYEFMSPPSIVNSTFHDIYHSSHTTAWIHRDTHVDNIAKRFISLLSKRPTNPYNSRSPPKPSTAHKLLFTSSRLPTPRTNPFGTSDTSRNIRPNSMVSIMWWTEADCRSFRASQSKS